MWTKLALAAYIIASANAAAAATKDLKHEFDVKPRGMAKLLANAELRNGRSLEDQGNNGDDYSRISSYSIQFQGCHHIQQWNKNADDEDVRLETKRLARFRLVPFDVCDVMSPWADSKVFRDAQSLVGNVDYGEYIVDMNTFVAAYFEAENEESYYACEEAEENCEDTCATDDAADDNAYSSCISSCYKGYGCNQNMDDDGGSGLDVTDYTACAAFDWDNGDDDAGYEYYFGPYCADQGGEIRMNLFTDDTCTTLASCNSGQKRGATCYTQSTGYTLPFTQESIVHDPCLPCSENYATLESSLNSMGEDEEFDYTNYDYGNPRDVCSNLYDLSGKCESNMNNGQYQNGCSYLEGIQIGVSQEGYAVAVRRSLPADAAMGALAIFCTFIGMYVYYLKHLLNKPLSS